MQYSQHSNAPKQSKLKKEKGHYFMQRHWWPKPIITWKKETQSGKVLPHNSTLVIENVDIFDEGMYNITANNGRTTSALVELKIICK